MAIKPFAIQGADLTLGGVSLQAGTAGVVIPGVTQATNYIVEEIDETGEQSYSFNARPFLIDAYTYLILDGAQSDPGNLWTRPEYLVDEIDDDGYIDGIEIVNAGSILPATVDNGFYNPTYMWASDVSTALDQGSWNASDWQQVPFRPKVRADDVENLGGGGDLGSFIFDGNVLDVESGTDIYIQTYETDGDGESRLILKPQEDDDGDNPTRIEGSYGVGIWSNTTDGDNIHKWLFGTNGNLRLPEGGTITEGIVTDNPTIQLTPASPDVASQKLVIKGGGSYWSIENGIEVWANYNTWAVNDTVEFFVYSETHANETLYWWIVPEDAGLTETTSGIVELDGTSNGSFTFILDSDDYEFTVRVSPENNIYDPETIGVESVLMNGDAPTYDVDYHLHLTTGDLTETSIFLGTDDHNVRTTTTGNIQITTPSGTNNVWTFGNDGNVTFPDGSVQATAYLGTQTEVKLWIAAGDSPGGAALLHSSTGLSWTTEDFMMNGTSIERVAMSTDKIVYLVSLDGPGSAIYYASDPEDVPTLVSNTATYGDGATVFWNEINYLGGKFVAVGYYETTGGTVSTTLNSIALAGGGRTYPRIAINNLTYNYDGTSITISGATNTELNGTFILQYNTADTLSSGVYDLTLDGGGVPTITSTVVTGATIADLTSVDGTAPLFAYSTNGVTWTYGDLDPTYIQSFGSVAEVEMSDVAYDGTGYLIPVIDRMFFVDEVDEPTIPGPGAFYITDITGPVGESEYIDGNDEPGGLPGNFNNIAAYADGTFFISDDRYTVWTGNVNDGWTSHDIRPSLVGAYGWEPETDGNDDNDIDSAVAGTVNGTQYWVATTNAGMVIYTSDQGDTFQVSIPDPYTSSINDIIRGTTTTIDFNGSTPAGDGEKIVITGVTTQTGEPGTTNQSYNGTYYIKYVAGDYELYTDSALTTPWNTTTYWPVNQNTGGITWSHGPDLEDIAIGDDSCIVYSGDAGKLYHSTDLVTWTAYSIDGPYSVNDIYFNSLVTITNITNQLTNGDYSLTLNSDGTTSVPGTIYPAYDQSIDIGTSDNQFDAIHVHNIKSKTHVNISTGLGHSYWFNIYGDITIDDSNFTGVSVDYDTDGNMYVIGNHIDNGDYNTLALKYSPDGNLIWRKAWVNNNNEPCGSANQKFFVKNDTIYWIASSGAQFTGNIYVGTMDLDGVITSSATKMQGEIVVNDMAVDSSDNVIIVGFRSDESNDYPYAAKINTSTNTVVWNTWLQDYPGSFRSVALDSSNNLFVVGTMTIGGDDYAVLSRIYADGEYNETVQVDDNNVGYGDAVTIYSDSVYVYHHKNSGGGIVSSFNRTDITDCNWSVLLEDGVLLQNGEVAYQPNDIITDGNGYIYAVAILTLDDDENFHVIRLNDQGTIQWQRDIGSTKEEGIGYYFEASNGSRMAAVLNDRLAITGYTLQNPLNDTTTYDNAKSITIQMPTDGTCTGMYGSFFIGNYGLSNETITSSVNLLDPFNDIDTSLVTYDGNDGFVPNTVLAKPENFAVKVEIRGPSTDGASWQFDTEGGITLPSGGRIDTNDYDGSITITAGDKSEIGNDSGDLVLLDGTENSAVTLQSTEARLTHEGDNYDSLVLVDNYRVRLEHDDLRWDFKADNGSDVGTVREPYGHHSIVRGVVQVNTDATDKVIWIARNHQITSGKFTVNIDTGANDSTFDTMTCEIVLAAKRVSGLNSEAKVSVYGLVYTSDDPLMTFDATIISGGSYTVADGTSGFSTSGDGAGASITIVANANGSYYSKGSIGTAGTGYKVNDTITITGNLLGGITDFTNSNYAKIIITEVNGSGGITDYDFAEDSGYTNAGRVAITCTPAAESANNLYVKIRGTESDSAIIDYYC